MGVRSYDETYLFSHPTLPLPIPVSGREVERLLPHCGGGWVGVRSYPAKQPLCATILLRRLQWGMVQCGECSAA